MIETDFRLIFFSPQSFRIYSVSMKIKCDINITKLIAVCDIFPRKRLKVWKVTLQLLFIAAIGNADYSCAMKQSSDTFYRRDANDNGAQERFRKTQSSLFAYPRHVTCLPRTNSASPFFSTLLFSRARTKYTSMRSVPLKIHHVGIWNQK